MKRMIALCLAISLVLCGCAIRREPPTPTQPTDPTAPTTEAEVERPNFGLYEQNPMLEVLSRGSAKLFPLPEMDYYAVAVVGEGLVLFSGTKLTTLHLLTEDHEMFSVPLKCYLDLNSSAVQVSDQGISYYDSSDHTLVTLDAALQESSRMTLPSDMVCAPVLSPDWQWIYYYTKDTLRSLEIRTGISRLLKESSFEIQEVADIHFDGTVLECRVGDQQARQRIFISTQTGNAWLSSGADGKLQTCNDRYFAKWFEVDSWKMLFGNRDENIQCLNPVWDGTHFPLLERNGLLLAKTDTMGGRLAYYDLEKGTRTSEAWLVNMGEPQSVAEDTKNGYVWILASETDSQRQCLYCWNPAKSAVEDESSYVMPYYTAESPDREGLEQCAQRAKELADQYGLRIRIWKDALSVMPDGYSFEGEYLVSVYEKNLDILEKALASFPKEIFQKLGRKSDNGKLTICLVREAYESNELGSQTYEEGVYFHSGGSAYIVLAMNETMEQTFYHELFHAMDGFVMTECKAYDYWDDLNPKGFEYDYSYITNQYREDEQYLENANRAFIDLYSMSFPREDRARIMEYAMVDGNDAYFESATMQAKLKMLCQGVREAFGFTKDTREFLWEQYLK